MPNDPVASYAALSSAGQALGRGILAGLVVGLDHVAVCVSNMDAAGQAWSALLGLPLVGREDVGSQRIVAAFLRPSEGGALELVCPSEGNVGLDRFLSKRGDSLHHIAFEVTDLGAALGRLAEAGVELIDKAPRPGAGGHMVAFIHPHAVGGTLVELVERHKE
jgi:methylmalonyl-CoA/ethylmalonyl-CoA epimerase